MTGASTSFTAQSDSTAPSGGAFSANGNAATGGGSSSYLNSGTTLTINSRTDYTDGGSGLASSTLTMATGTLSGNSCSAYGAPATIVGTTSQTVATAHCYLLTLTGTDNVGNAASISTTVMVDTTAPSAPTGFTFSGLTNAYYPGAGSTVYFKGGAPAASPPPPPAPPTPTPASPATTTAPSPAPAGPTPPAPTPSPARPPAAPAP